MARIKKVTKINRGINMCNEDSTDKKLERTIMDVNTLNCRKFCNNDRNRRILLNLRSYPNLFLTNNFSSNLLSAVRKYSISVCTQTANERFDVSEKTISTQTDKDVPNAEEPRETQKKLLRRSKSDISLLRKFELYSKNNMKKSEHISDFGITNNLKRCEDKEIHKNVMILHENSNLECSELLPIKKMKNKKRKRYSTRIYKKKKTYTQYHPRKITKHSRKPKDLEVNEGYMYYNQLVKKIGKYSLTTVANCSSKLIKIFADLGISLTESLTNLYKLYESQKLQSSNLTCNCNEFNPKIDQLLSKLTELEQQLNICQNRINEQQKCVQNIDELKKKLEELTLKLESYESLKLEMSALKKEFQGCSKTTSTPPPPPPLPPLPIFSLTTNCDSKTFLKVVQNERKLINCENSRPMITLQDILNVKLKKISVTSM